MIYRFPAELLMVFPLFFSNGFLYAQDQIAPRFKYEIELSNKRCGQNLDKHGLQLQEKGIRLFYIKGKIDEAVAILNEAIETEPRLFPSYSQLSFYYSVIEKDPDKSITLLRKGISHCPNEPWLYFDLADCYATMGKNQDALTNYSKAQDLGIEPLPSFFFNFGNSYYDLNQFDKAAECYRKALNLDLRHFKAWQNLVLAYYALGDKANAVSCALQLERFDPKGEYGVWARAVLKIIKPER